MAERTRADQSHNRDPARSKRLLIEATLESIAQDGITETTVSKIIERAGLSRGMIHLHFGGKENLLVAAAENFSGVYYSEMDQQITGKSGSPAEMIMAVVRADLSDQILNERSVAIWHAFRGAAPTNAAIASYSDTRDKRLRTMICDEFTALLKPQDLNNDVTIANEVTLGTLALLEGMWTDFLTHPNAFSRETAVRIVARFLDGLFPGEFR
ncbi:MAG: TetR family transcriptional regulator [Rhodobacteraceae bacterium]|nr:TetR family transcriptional regulator [Paracoccaceae bacterium]